MASLAGALTTLGLLGISTAAPVFDTEYATSPKPYTVTFTQLGLNAGPVVRHVDYSGKVSPTDSAFDVFDTASVSATESPVDSQEITTNDVARVAASESISLLKRLDPTDTALVAVSESISLVIGGVTDKPVTDTASVSAADVATLDVTIDVSDTASVSTTDVAVVDVSVEQIIVSDTASVSTTDEALRNVFAGVNVIAAADFAFITVGESARVIEVGRIRKAKVELSSWTAKGEIN